MIRPAAFGFNKETANCNSFQSQVALHPYALQEFARMEFDQMVVALKAHGIDVFVVDDTEVPAKPDAIFPNNWVSFHEGGKMVVYPMKARNRRYERNSQLIETLENEFSVQEVIDLSASESRGRYLEGTGSLVLDRVNKIAYATLSPRTHTKLLKEFCRIFNYELFSFNTRDFQGEAIYHTNVMLTIGTDFAIICDELIADDRERVLDRLYETGKTIIPITVDQVAQYCGNMLELSRPDKRPLLVLSRPHSML